MSREKRAEYQMGKYYIRKREVWTFFVIFLTVLCMLKTGLADVGGVCCGTDKFDHSYVLNGNGPHDIIAVAEKQAGKGQNALGYTDAWCAAFVNDCAKLAGQSDAIPFVSGVTHGVDGLYREVKKRGGQSVSSVQKGDLVFYYCSECGCFYHVGIMIDANKSIEGNFGGICSYRNNRISNHSKNNHNSKEGILSCVYIRPNYKTQDSIKPVVSNVKISNISTIGYTVTCDVSDNNGVTRVAFPTWTEWNGQDDLASTWPSVTVSSGANQTQTVSYTVRTSDHYNEVGTYITHIYAYDAAGNATSVTQSNYSSLRFDIAGSLKNRFTLPKNLKQIGDEAFANTGVQVATIPDATTKIGSKAFPSDIVVYWKNAIPRTVAPDALLGVRIFDTTQYTDWSAWSAWSKTKQTITDRNLKQEESRTVYPYYAFVCPTCGFHSPYWGSSANHNHTISSSDWRTNLDNITTPKSGCTKNGAKYETTYNGEKWYYWDDSSAPQPYTQYRYRTRQVK